MEKRLLLYRQRRLIHIEALVDLNHKRAVIYWCVHCFGIGERRIEGYLETIVSETVDNAVYVAFLRLREIVIEPDTDVNLFV